MHGAQGQATRLGQTQRGGDGLQIAHLSDENDVGVLAKHGPQGILEGMRVRGDLSLLDQAALVGMDELDRILESDDVSVSLAIDVVDMAANVVDLPDPVGPVTRTSPFGR